MTPTQDYLEKCTGLIDCIRGQSDAIQRVADRFAQTILSGRMVHLFGSGHSRIMVEEMWPRYGSFPGFNPMVELSLSFHHAVVGSNGQRQAMFLENVSGFAERILRNYFLKEIDSVLVVSSSGCNIVPVEIAEGFKRRGIFVAALVSRLHSEASSSKRLDGRKLGDFADVVLDNGAPVGDAMVKLDGLEQAVAPGSTVGGCVVINCLKAEVAKRLIEAGQPPRALASSVILGNERAAEVFEAAYDEHAHRLARLFAEVGPDQ